MSGLSASDLGEWSLPLCQACPVVNLILYYIVRLTVHFIGYYQIVAACAAVAFQKRKSCFCDEAHHNCHPCGGVQCGFVPRTRTPWDLQACKGSISHSAPVGVSQTQGRRRFQRNCTRDRRSGLHRHSLHGRAARSRL